jgi:hypothetical protein
MTTPLSAALQRSDVNAPRARRGPVCHEVAASRRAVQRSVLGAAVPQPHQHHWPGISYSHTITIYRCTDASQSFGKWRNCQEFGAACGPCSLQLRLSGGPPRRRPTASMSLWRWLLPVRWHLMEAAMPSALARVIGPQRVARRPDKLSSRRTTAALTPCRSIVAGTGSRSTCSNS